jgi:hypothetical protein
MKIPKVQGHTKRSVRAFLRARLGTDLSWAKRACVVLYRNRQTDREQKTDTTLEHNGIGFDRLDAPRMSRLARLILGKRSLTQGEIGLLLRRMPRYTDQIIKLSNLKKLERHITRYYGGI